MAKSSGPESGKHGKSFDFKKTVYIVMACLVVTSALAKVAQTHFGWTPPALLESILNLIPYKGPGDV